MNRASWGVHVLAALVFVGCNEGALRRERGAPEPGVTQACLSIVAWNDLHGQLSPDEPYIDTGRLPAGGVVALADELASIRATGDDVVVLDAGDLFTGPLDSTLAEGAPVIDAYAVMAVDAAAVGNHEFDFGPVGYAKAIAPAGVGDEAGDDGPRGALMARMASASFPFVSANIKYAGGKSVGWKNLHPSTVIARGAYKVGVVGYTTIETPTTTLRPNVVGLEFGNGAQSVGAAIRTMRAAGASPIVLLAHASIEGDLPQSLDDASDPEGVRRIGEMAKVVDELGDDRPDVIVAGHRHAWMLGRVRGIPIVSSDQHGVGLARIRYCASGKTARPMLDAIERRVPLAHTPPRSELGVKVAAAIAPWQARVRAEAEAVVAKVPRACLHQGLNGTALAEQVARAVAAHVGDAAPVPAGVPLVALVNAGGLRAPILAGTVKFADLFAAFPFENAVGVCGTTKAGLTRLIKNALEKRSARERFPFGITGAHLSLRREASGALELVSVEIGGKPGAKDDQPIWLALPDFILWGGDAFLDGVACKPLVASTTRVRDAWRTVLATEQGGCDGPAKNLTIEVSAEPPKQPQP